MLNRLKHILPINILVIIYNSLINSFLHYCILTWGFNINRILNLQKRSLRIITKSYFLEHTDNLFKNLKILKINDIFSIHQFVFYHKFLNFNLPVCLNNILTKQAESVRSCHSSFFLKPPQRFRTESARLCIRHSIPNLINTFNRDFVTKIKDISVDTLKRNFKILTLSQYNFVCTDPNCYPCYSRFFNSLGFLGNLKYLHIFSYMNDFVFHRLFPSTGILTYLNILNYINVAQ